MTSDSERGKVYTDDMDVGRTPRWMAASVMMVACAGFVGLAWYAYHAGTRSMHDEDLALIEPDGTPVKEKPADPGGMKFPNQDKTIFEAISGAPRKVAAVERVVPGPEEPVSRDQMAGGDTKTWINDKLAEKDTPPNQDALKDALIEKTAAAPKKPDAGNISPSAGTPSVPAQQPQPAAAPAAQPQQQGGAIESSTLPEVDVQQKAETPKAEAKPEAKPAPGEAARVELKKPESDKPVEAKPAETKPAAPKAEAKPAAKPAAKEEKPKEAKAAAPASKKKAAGKGVIQLGAYRTEEEAKKAWNKLRAKYHDLSFANPEIRRADLGEKGVYYRLRTHVSDPKGTCQAFNAKGQPCIVVK